MTNTFSGRFWGDQVGCSKPYGSRYHIALLVAIGGTSLVQLALRYISGWIHGGGGGGGSSSGASDAGDGFETFEYAQ